MEENHNQPASHLFPAHIPFTHWGEHSLLHMVSRSAQRGRGLRLPVCACDCASAVSASQPSFPLCCTAMTICLCVQILCCVESGGNVL